MSSAVKAAMEGRSVWSEDYYEFFKLNDNRLVKRKSCWNCIYGDFGINTDSPTDEGKCTYLEIAKVKK
jgi:hypothetical protein